MEPPPLHRDSLPAELIYDIVVDIFAQYLQQAIVEVDLPSPQWNAFVVLPNVSRLFYSLSQPLFRKIFGEASQEAVDLATRKERYATSKALWARTRLESVPEWNPVVEQFDPDDIPRPYNPPPPSNILALYDTISRGRYFFNSRAMHVEDEETMCCLRLWCPYMAQAFQISKDIYPRRLLQSVGAHIVAEITYCHSFDCVDGVKNALDHLFRNPQANGDLESCVHQNLTSLKTLELNKWQFMWLEGSYIADAFPMCTTPSRKMLIDTKIMESLPFISEYDWQEDPNKFKERTEELTNIYATRMAGCDS